MGGYTTFSTFSLETVLLIERSQYLTAFSYVLGSFVLSVGAAFGAFWALRVLFGPAEEASRRLGGSGAPTTRMALAEYRVPRWTPSAASSLRPRPRSIGWPTACAWRSARARPSRQACRGSPHGCARACASPARSDNGNYLADRRIGALADPVRLERAPQAIPGVIEIGLFVGFADLVIVSDGTSVAVHRNQSRQPYMVEIGARTLAG
jgi:hypothetical protein